MKTLGEQGAFPLTIADNEQVQFLGLTKREYFAITLLSGYISNPQWRAEQIKNPELNFTAKAVILADELLKQLTQ
jgi:hypothetical protein